MVYLRSKFFVGRRDPDADAFLVPGSICGTKTANVDSASVCLVFALCFLGRCKNKLTLKSSCARWPRKDATYMEKISFESLQRADPTNVCAVTNDAHITCVLTQKRLATKPGMRRCAMLLDPAHVVILVGPYDTHLNKYQRI